MVEGRIIQRMMIELECASCGNDEAVLQTGADIYPGRSDLKDGFYWQCTVCDGYVGCHKPGIQPLGLPGDQLTRIARMKAHQEFDKLWLRKGGMKRNDAYAWLALALGISRSECHISRMNAAKAWDVHRVAKQFNPPD